MLLNLIQSIITWVYHNMTLKQYFHLEQHIVPEFYLK